jgi:hypothetical protein
LVIVLFFKLEEEETLTLLLHLPKLFAETADFGSGSSLGCWLVVETVQPRAEKKQFNLQPIRLLTLISQV